MCQQDGRLPTTTATPACWVHELVSARLTHCCEEPREQTRHRGTAAARHSARRAPAVYACTPAAHKPPVHAHAARHSCLLPHWDSRVPQCMGFARCSAPDRCTASVRPARPACLCSSTHQEHPPLTFTIPSLTPSTPVSPDAQRDLPHARATSLDG
ncbi:MAG: hypothetical protein WDW38_008193 [Sanguina aurantia]